MQNGNITLGMIWKQIKCLWAVVTTGTPITTEDSATVTFTGDGTADSPLIAEVTGSGDPVNTIYSADGTIGDATRTVTIPSGNNLQFKSAPTVNDSTTFSFTYNNMGMRHVNSSNDPQVVAIDRSTGTPKTDVGTVTSTTKYSKFSSYSGSLISNIEASNNSNLGYQRVQVSPTQIDFISSATTGTAARQAINTAGWTVFASSAPGNESSVLSVTASTKAVNLPMIVSAPFLKTGVGGIVTAGTAAAHVDPTTGTTTQIINALIAAGLMA